MVLARWRVAQPMRVFRLFGRLILGRFRGVFGPSLLRGAVFRRLEVDHLLVGGFLVDFGARGDGRHFKQIKMV